MRNKDVVKAFINKECAKGSNLESDGNKLINYCTTIAQWYEGILILNTTKYSVTTSKIQSVLYREAYSRKNEFNIVPVSNVPRNIVNLKYYL